MALNTYATLQTAIADWLNRTDLTATIPDFITLAEAEIKRRLRRSTTRTTITVNDEAETAPADMAELRALNFVSAQAWLDRPLDICTPEMLAERRARFGGVSARPLSVAYIAGQLVFAPPPDTTYTAEIVYFTQLTPLSVSNTSNAVLVEAPDAYLYGALLQAEPYLEHDARLPVWQGKFDAAIDQLNAVRQNEEYGASLRPIRLPVVFG